MTPPSVAAEFLAAPPLWFRGAVTLVAVVVLGTAARNVLRQGTPATLAQHRAMLLIVWTAEGVGFATALSMTLLEAPYLLDVGLGLAGGFGAVEIGRRSGPRLVANLGERKQVALGWAALLVAVYGMRLLALLADVEVPVALLVAAFGTAGPMLAWIVLQDVRDGRLPEEAITEAD